MLRMKVTTRAEGGLEMRGVLTENVRGFGERETTSTRRFPTYQIPALRFHALLTEKAPEVELVLASS